MRDHCFVKENDYLCSDGVLDRPVIAFLLRGGGELVPSFFFADNVI